MLSSSSYPVPDEEALWRLLEGLLAEVPSSPDASVRPQISGWQPELLFFPDEPVGYSISPTTARAISDFHTSLSRAYAYLLYREPNARRLKTEDRENLEIKILVVKGSNGFNVFDGALDALVKGALAKMTGSEITISIVVFLLLYFSGSLGRHWISQHYSERKRIQETKERVDLSREETRRAEIMAKALTNHPELRPLSETADDGKVALIKAATSTDRARVLGAEVTAEIAKAIAAKPRETGRGKRLDGLFEVVEIGTENPDGFTGRLRNTETGEEFAVEMSFNGLTKEDIDALFRPERRSRSRYG